MTLETQYKNFLKDNPNSNLPFEEWMKVHSRLLEQALINMMKDDEELGLYNESKPFKDMLSTNKDEWNEFTHSPFPSKKQPFKHKVETIPAEEILANRSNAYEFIDFDKQETKELNPHIGPFLLKNGFKGSGGDTYYNSECTINVLEYYYQIDFNHPEYGEVSTYTDSHSIPHLVGVLTWNDLIDKNYKK
jgi:hypothetical protein